jgi:hypothetical protein
MRRLPPLVVLTGLAVFILCLGPAFAVPYDEDFETGTLTKWPWTTGASADWVVDTISPHGGVYSAKSGAMPFGGMSYLRVSMNCAGGNISFFRRVSGGRLRFIVDIGTIAASWSGDVPWGEFTYYLTAGTHELMWLFDTTGTEADAAWLDDIDFPLPGDDTTAPGVTLNSADPPVLWPPNHKSVAVSVTGSVVDEGSGVARAWLEIDDEYDELDGTQDLTLDAEGGFSATVNLIAWRLGDDLDGRTYEISLHAVDNAGNEADPVSALVVVPHDQRR